MHFKHLLIANRGEISIRISRAASELGIVTSVVYSEDDSQSLHIVKADQGIALTGRGVSAYLDSEQLISCALQHGCDAVHPGYGFLSERADFARDCAAAGLKFVGPEPETLEIFGDKVRAKELAVSCGVAVVPGIDGDISLERAREFFKSLGSDAAIMVKALSGGGGRGMRLVSKASELEEALVRCRSEALAAFGQEDLYLEKLISPARHIEIQILGDGTGAVNNLGERECSLQRQHQKLVEIAPSPSLSSGLRKQMIEAATEMAAAVQLSGLATFEFLLDEDAQFSFIETNPRLQVEHTVTEEVTGVDLVQTQLRLAAGASLADLNLDSDQLGAARGFAIQARINMETLDARAQAKPSGGVLATFEPPNGPGVRIDTFAYTGYTTVVSFDSLLAKLIVHSNGSYSDVVRKAYRALCEFGIEGVETNLEFLKNLFRHPRFLDNDVHTNFVTEEIDSLLDQQDHPAFSRLPSAANEVGKTDSSLAGASIDSNDPLAILAHGKRNVTPELSDGDSSIDLADSSVCVVRAPIQGTIVEVRVEEEQLVHTGQALLVMEAMKMEHVICADVSGKVTSLVVQKGNAVFENHVLLLIKEGDVEESFAKEEQTIDPDHIREDLAEMCARHTTGLDVARPKAVARRRKTGHRTARENIADLCDPDTFVEYGPLMIAAQRRRRSLEDLMENTPADGMVAGVGSINRGVFPDAEAGHTQCVLMSYDYTVLAGTQGAQNHRKKDRLFEIAEQRQLPLVLFAEGGGGRPGDTDGVGGSGLDCLAFTYFAKLSGLVPLIGITTGRCFAGNAALLGCCDVVIATMDSNIGMGGPAMIEGGGLGNFRPEEVGPMSVQVPNGVVDIAVQDEAEAVEVAKQYLSYFQGAKANWNCADQRKLRSSISENRLRIYDIHQLIETLADENSVLELRESFGLGMITAFIRIEGRAVGLIANNPAHLAGAIDSNGADKASRFMQLCDAFDIPLLFLCDTPGIMVGPEVEKTALVRHAARMFVVSASLSVPFFTIVLRKGYGLGAQAMAGGSFKAPTFTVAWPTGEFGGMGLEGAVKLGYRKELAALEDPDARTALYEEKVARMYEQGKAVNAASYFMLDDVIDPADSRKWINMALLAAPTVPGFRTRKGKKRACVDTW